MVRFPLPAPLLLFLALPPRRGCGGVGWLRFRAGRFWRALVPAGVAVCEDDHCLVADENSVTELGFGFTIGGFGMADTFLVYASTLVFGFDESEYVYGVSVCCFEYVGQGDLPSISCSLVVFRSHVSLCRVFACCSILWIVYEGLPAIAVRQAPRRLGRLVLLFGFGAVSPFVSCLPSALNPCVQMRAKTLTFIVSGYMFGFVCRAWVSTSSMFMACVGAAQPHVDRGCALRGDYSESV